jgi:mannose-6-phosphate isomerase class I
MSEFMESNYDKQPFIPVSSSASDCIKGWPAIMDRLRSFVNNSRSLLVVECYPGTEIAPIVQALTKRLHPARIWQAEQCYKTPEQLVTFMARDLGDDPVFGRMNGLCIENFFDPDKLATVRSEIAQGHEGMGIIIGTGASLLARRWDCLVYADMARWELQLRQRQNRIGNLGLENLTERPSLKYKRAFFVDWRAADRLKKQVWAKVDFLLDTHVSNAPRMITGVQLRAGLERAARRPFRVVPFFDPAPWGGQWMKQVCGLDPSIPNYGWCFDCVPEENSLLLGFGSERVEIPSIDLVFFQPRELLGDAVHARFGTEFPIRFDFLDTMDGGNLSLQVHPLTEYIQDKFGMNYTQDESYYLLDAAPGAEVYLGVKSGIDADTMIADLYRAQEEGLRFPDEKYINRWPARKHDHFLIPGGTIHCSGKSSMVLEISATPFIFTFKLWDWERLGLDGRPRPIHLAHGAANIQWHRDTHWVKQQLVNQIEPVGESAGWREERTGLHEREFIETRRHWFTGTVPHHTRGGLNVLNLVEGREAAVESPQGAFDPFVVHYAETFIVPAAAGEYTIRPCGSSEGQRCATVKAYVRHQP